MRPLFVLTLWLSACGGGPPGPSAMQCDYSGSLMGTLPCSVTDATWAQSSDTTLFHLASRTVANPVLAIEYGFNGQPGNGHFVGAAVRCVFDFYDSSTQAHWYATTSPTERNGTCELTLSTVKERADNGATKDFELHGTFAASLAAGDKATGTIELTGGF
jgi:hypothetical protein